MAEGVTAQPETGILGSVSLPVAPDSRSQRLLEAIHDLATNTFRWPTFEDLDRHLHLQGEDDAEELLLALPEGLVFGVSPRDTIVRDDAEIALTIAGMASCPDARGEVEMFLAAVRVAAEKVSRLQPGEPPATISSETIAAEMRLSTPIEDPDGVRRLWLLLRYEFWGSNGSSWSDDAWTATVHRRARRLKGVETVEDYWRTTRPNDRHAARVETADEPSPINPPQPSLFISYSHRDKDVAHALADTLEDLGVEIRIDVRELRAGDSIIGRIFSAMAEVQFVAVLVSEDFLASAFCRKELETAVNQGLQKENVRVLPLRLGDAAMPPAIQDTFFLDVDPSDLRAVATTLFKHCVSHLEEGAQDSVETTAQARPALGIGFASSAHRRIPSGLGPEPDAWTGVQATGYGREVVDRMRRTGVTPEEYVRGRTRRSSPPSTPTG